MPLSPTTPLLDSPVPSAPLRRVLDQIGDGVVLADDTGRITFVNAAAAHLHGVAELGVPVERWSTTFGLAALDGTPFPAADLPLARAALRGEEVAGARWRIRRPDGSEVVAEGTASPLFGEDGRRVGGVLVVHDVTERVLLREAVRARDERARGLDAATPVGIFHADLAGNVSYVNARATELWQLPESALLGHGWTARVHPDDLEALLTAWADANAQGRDYEHEFRVVRDDGSCVSCSAARRSCATRRGGPRARSGALRTSTCTGRRSRSASDSLLVAPER